ncbi:menaquinone biosynthetic enzyme MqnA/MqnD family protein [Pseudodesulfovibrio tunisiensis]|uniref:menaquinone biosynthetic enzyme MqnA/MqnD family protein n=1 Tax=Pseudodesulfovibrio tunisiensis TaxID=463192 RepID=UPI001FB34525|nr:menaquinone biosynthesis protein [Pseudodesulfovibrio tunisiensis]
MSIRLGKIGYLNVLPIYHPLEQKLIDNDFEIVSGPPAALNRLMDNDELALSAASSIEYARHPEKYYLIPNLSIGSCGPVQSVLLLSRYPVEELGGKTILVSSQSHTSAALLKVLLSEHWRVDVEFRTGDATSMLESGKRPAAILAIGDEALNLRRHPDYPIRIDMGEAWRNLTGLPFIFGVWIVQRNKAESLGPVMLDACAKLIQAKVWGVQNMPKMCALAAASSILNPKEMCSYFGGLVYDLGPEEQKGLHLFYENLHKTGMIPAVPELKFVPGCGE